MRVVGSSFLFFVVRGVMAITEKNTKQTTKGETQIPQPDMRFAIQQRNKAKSERGRAQQKQPQPSFAMDTVVKSHCVATHKKMHKRIGCCPEM